MFSFSFENLQYALLWKEEKKVCKQNSVAMEYVPNIVLCPSQKTVPCRTELKALSIEKLAKFNIFSATFYKSQHAR